MSDAIDKRNFLLMLSPQEGQEYAKSMGFSTPSPEVVEAEATDVLAKWGVFVAFDIYSEIVEAANWYVEFLAEHGKLDSEAEEVVGALSIFSIGLLSKLVDSEKVIIAIPEDLEMSLFVDLGDDNE